jgi:hypothetical protein
VENQSPIVTGCLGVSDTERAIDAIKSAAGRRLTYRQAN